MNNWEKCYSRTGSPYYLNMKTMKSQWEHPYFAKVLADAADYNDVIYAAYRTALKLLHIRNNHHLQTLDVEKIECAFTDVLSLRGIKVDEYLTLTQLDEIMHRLYMYCDTTLGQAVWTGAMSSCLLYFFDGKKRGTVNTLGVLVFLTTLCADKLTNKYSFLFDCLSQHDLVGAQDISHLKRVVFTLLTRLQEDKAYKNAYQGNGTTMTKDMFLKWLLSEPKFVVWLSTMHRIHAAVSVMHGVKCYRCKSYPIAGLRYRCLQCFNVNMCFQCFTRIPAYGKHDKSHSIEEYCVPSNKMQDMKAFITKLRNNVKKKSKQSKSVDEEFDLTASRQPARVWHDPKLADPEYYRSSTDIHNDLSIPSTYTPVHSPAIDRHTSAHYSSRGSALDGYHSLRRGSTNSQRYKEESLGYPNRYCQSLPRRSRGRSSAQSPDRVITNRSCVPENAFNRSPARQDVKEHSNSTPHKPINPNYSLYKSTPPPPEKTILYNHAEPTPHYSARIKYNRNRELYASANRTAIKPTEVLELDFYSTSTRQAVPYNSSRVLSHSQSYHHNNNTPNNKPARPQCTNAYSEDEGIVVNSESDSSVSQFATYDNRDLYDVSGQSSQTRQSDLHPRFDPAMPQRGANSAYDYTRYTWDKSRETPQEHSLYTEWSADRATYRPSEDNRQPFDKTLSPPYGQGLLRAVDGIQAALSPMALVHQV